MFGQKPKVKPVPSTPFSEFIRNAKSGEKKRVYTDVMRKASEAQNRALSRLESSK
jgi:negative regulator of replication initiation